MKLKSLFFLIGILFFVSCQKETITPNNQNNNTNGTPTDSTEMKFKFVIYNEEGPAWEAQYTNQWWEDTITTSVTVSLSVNSPNTDYELDWSKTYEGPVWANTTNTYIYDVFPMQHVPIILDTTITISNEDYELHLLYNGFNLHQGGPTFIEENGVQTYVDTIKV